MRELFFVNASFDDAEQLVQFALESHDTYGYRTVSDAQAKQVFRLRQTDFESGIVSIMKRGDETIGFFSLVPRVRGDGVHVNELAHLFLKPSYMRKGYGRILFHQAIKVAKIQLGWSRIQWESDPNAAGFYEKMGAIQIGKKICPLNEACETPVFLYYL